MKKVLIIIGFTLLIAFARCANDGWNETDEICNGNKNCTSLNTTNSAYSCCTYKYEYKENGKNQKPHSYGVKLRGIS